MLSLAAHRQKRRGALSSVLPGSTWLVFIGIVLLACGEPGQIASARQATPPASPSAITCDVAPRSVTEIMTLVEPMQGVDFPALPLPAGDPADPDTTAAIAAVLGEMGACLTGGEMLRFYALHSDDWLRRFTAEIEGLATMSASARPLADGHRAVYLGPWHVQILDDGRVLAAVLLNVGDELRPDPKRTKILLFVHRDGRWLVDETIDRVRIAGCDGPVDVVAVVGPPPGAMFDSWLVTRGADCRPDEPGNA